MTDSSFNFFQHWYPIAPLEDLPLDRPRRFVLLDRGFVVWKPRDSEGYRVFLDVCPHRLAPLSEGRIDEKTGCLSCSYHGWEFDESGDCTRIPQLENPELLTKNRKLYSATALPTQEANGLLWVWPDADSASIAASTPLPLPVMIDSEWGFTQSSVIRDLEYDWATLVENLADVAHVPFAHHGIQGRRELATPLEISITASTRERIEAQIDRQIKTTIIFTPPCLLEYRLDYGGGKLGGIVGYCIPVSAGKSRVVAQFPRNFRKPLEKLIPRWWEHISVRNFTLDGDMILLHYQEYLLKKQAEDNWKSAYNLASGADRIVIEFRRWFDIYCAGRLPWQKNETSDELPTSDRRQMLDRYRQHTSICGSCSKALKNFHRLKVATLLYFALAVSTAAVLPDNSRVLIGLPLVLTALFGLLLHVGIKYWLEPKFYFVDYVHAEH